MEEEKPAISFAKQIEEGFFVKKEFKPKSAADARKFLRLREIWLSVKMMERRRGNFDEEMRRSDENVLGLDMQKHWEGQSQTCSKSDSGQNPFSDHEPHHTFRDAHGDAESWIHHELSLQAMVDVKK